MLPVFRNTVKPLLSGHPLDLAKSPFNRGCLLKELVSFPFQTNQRLLYILGVKRYEKGTMLPYFATLQEIRSHTFLGLLMG